MKLVTNKETTIKLLAEILSEYQIFAEELVKSAESNPFAAAAEKSDAGGGDAEAEEPAADAEGGDKDAKDDKKGKPAEPAGLTVEFNLSAVKKYNEKAFRSNKGEVKAINKNGLEVAVDNNETIHVNFQDITNE